MDATTKPPLSEIRRSVLAYIVSHLGECGRSPTYREICARFGWKSVNAAMQHVHELAGAGYVELSGDGERVVLVPEIQAAIIKAASEAAAKYLKGIT